MKNFWFLFSFLLLSLSVYPCGDSEECETKTLIKVIENTNHEKHNHEAEQCPPFCSCACCGVNVFQSQNQVCSFTENLVYYSQRESLHFYTFIYNKKVANKIWQPPKIS
jgi:hypothetical protein